MSPFTNYSVPTQRFEEDGRGIKIGGQRLGAEDRGGMGEGLGDKGRLPKLNRVNFDPQTAPCPTALTAAKRQPGSLRRILAPTFSLSVSAPSDSICSGSDPAPYFLALPSQSSTPSGSCSSAVEDPGWAWPINVGLFT